MKVYVKGKSFIELNNTTFLSDGGMGDVHVKNDTAYKIYKDITTAVPESKIRELSVLTNPDIIKPEDILLNQKNENIGYTMRFIKNAYSLVQIFPKAFRQRENLTPDKTLHLVKKLQEGIQYIHSHHILLVDINENNFLVEKNFDSIYFIDTDSYQTKSFGASAISDLIRDRHASRFSELTDWFSFGVIAFQLFRGIHPYRGTHPKWTSLDDRMIHNISIMNPEVKYPQNAVIDESVVPQVYQDWFRASKVNKPNYR